MSKQKIPTEGLSPVSSTPPRRKRCLNCDELFGPGPTPRAQRMYSRQRFCKDRCRVAYHQLLGGTSIRRIVKKLVAAEVGRLVPPMVLRMITRKGADDRSNRLDVVRVLSTVKSCVAPDSTSTPVFLPFCF